MAYCGIVTLADIPYPYNRVLRKLLSYSELNGIEFTPDGWDMGLDYDPVERAEWGSPHLGSLNNNSNEFHEEVAEEVSLRQDIVIRKIREWVEEEGMDNVWVDSLYNDPDEASEFIGSGFYTELWNEIHSSKGGFGDSGIVHFITKGYMGINVIYEPYSPILEQQEVQERTYYIPLQLIGTIRGDYGLNKKGDWEGYAYAREFALTQIDDGIVNMRHLSAIVECIR